MEQNHDEVGSGINSGLLGTDHKNPMHHLQNPSHHHMQNQPQIALFGSSSSSSSHHHETEKHQKQHINKHHGIVNYPPFSTKNKHTQHGSPSDEDDPENISIEPSNKRKNNNNSSDNNNVSSSSPWQRMKWTDTMVRLLIVAVYYIGDEGASELGADNSSDPNNNVKKVVVNKSTTKGSLIHHQKKGKWKSVSRAMVEKGFCVSPQQCEDKFNDLNKRYKRVNDVLGKGTACKVVENQNLLEKMDHLSQKVKDEVRKLLNSKHLFFREMCAYHNSCGHGVGSGSVQHNQEQVGVIGVDDASQSQQQQQQEKEQEQQKCSHLSDEGVSNNLGVFKLECVELDDDHDDGDGDGDGDDDDDESEDYSDDGDEGNESGEGGSKGHQHEEEYEHDHDHEDDDENNNNKRPRKLASSPSSSSCDLMQQLSNEVSVVLQDGGKSIWEKKQWLKSRIVKLEEEQVNYERKGIEIEKKKVKWERFSRKKEREMEKAKIENEMRRLENERMVLLIQQKEIELMNLHQQQQQKESSI